MSLRAAACYAGLIVQRGPIESDSNATSFPRMQKPRIVGIIPANWPPYASLPLTYRPVPDIA